MGKGKKTLIIRKEVDFNKIVLTDEMIRELEKMNTGSINFDGDCSGVNAEELAGGI